MTHTITPLNFRNILFAEMPSVKFDQNMTSGFEEIKSLVTTKNNKNSATE